MQFWEFTDENQETNLAIDEALLEVAERLTEEQKPFFDVLRLWELKDYAVVMGRGSKLTEVHVECCRRDHVPIFRRCSGGTSVVAGPGCLMYSLVLNSQSNPKLRQIDYVHRFVMTKMLNALLRLEPRVAWCGTCDLTLNGRKFSGNALRCKRSTLLYHGTLLYKFDLNRVSRYLATPPREPDYRHGRSHDEFLTNLEIDRKSMIATVATEWQANDVLLDGDYLEQVRIEASELLEEKYRCPSL